MLSCLGPEVLDSTERARVGVLILILIGWYHLNADESENFGCISVTWNFSNANYPLRIPHKITLAHCPRGREPISWIRGSKHYIWSFASSTILLGFVYM
jgi:hypothetical protein